MFSLDNKDTRTTRTLNIFQTFFLSFIVAFDQVCLPGTLRLEFNIKFLCRVLLHDPICGSFTESEG